MSRRTPLARRVIAAFLLVLITACQTWRPTFVSPQELIPVERPSSVRATLRSGAKVILDDPTVRNDSIFGVTDGGERVGVASRDVGLFEVRRFSILRSIGLGYVSVAGAYIVALVIGCSLGAPCEIN